MAGSGPDWQGLLKWSLSHSDGTSSARKISDEDRKWFMEAMHEQTLDVIRRMKEISTVMNMPPDVLRAQGVTDEDLEGLQVLQYLLHENPNDSTIVAELGFVRLLTGLIGNSNADIRQAALHSLLEMAHSGKLFEENGEDSAALKQALGLQIEKVHSMESDELVALKEERLLLDTLWQVCSNEPSLLRERGLVVLAEDNESPPDVAGRIFEPALRAWAAPRPQEASQSEVVAQNPPLLLGAAPHSTADS
ncbi:hypothetical protein KP509_01G067900 [Ceratopteris richardii]|uniref:Nucleotide exchange factor Fes1 domain-containing protein n=1 Tax=Ceratopteris richardii TaxID=49495 RepID=A0A8T2VHE1_CERRI|nr:hypothetical protein KP509_01G067900 [Ceratopteris richardii]